MAGSLATLAGVLTACAQAADTDIAVSIAPASAIVKVADAAHANPGTQQFVATVSGSEEQAVLWEICHGATCSMTGEWSQFGTIGLDGVFTAPLVLPNPTTFTIKATPVADPDKSATATVTIDRNVHWRVTTGISMDSPAPDWQAMRTPGEHQVYYHVLHDGQMETCTPSLTSPEVGPCYRQVIFHVGKGYQQGKAGAVLFFHGAGGRIEKCSDWKAENDKHGWITVCMQGAYGPPRRPRSWNSFWAGRKGTPTAPEAVPDDSAMAWGIAKDLVAHLGVNPRRIHAVGNSAGVTMIARLATDNGALFASFAQGPGVMYSMDHRACLGERESCNPPSKFPQVHAFPPFGYGVPNINYPVSIIMIMGTADKATPLCGTHNNNPNVDEAFRMYADMFQCRTRGPNDEPFCPYVPDQSPSCQMSKFVPGSGRACAPGNQVYKHARNCAEGVEISAYSLINGEHRWELTDISDPANPIHNTRLRTDFPDATPPKASGSQTAIVWDFFNNHPQPER